MTQPIVTQALMTKTLWIDIEDLFNYTRIYKRPSGIQRVAFEISRSLHGLCGDAGVIRFVRYDPLRNRLRTVRWSEIAALFSGLTEAAEPSPKRYRPADAAPANPRIRRFVRRLIYRLPGSVQTPLINALKAQYSSLRAWGSLFGEVSGGLVRTLRRRASSRAARRRDQAGSAPGLSVIVEMTPGDTLLTLGAHWSHPDYTALIAKHQRQSGLRYAMMVYDIIPLRRPEWCGVDVVSSFRGFFESMMPLCDRVLAISRATAADLTDYAREHDIKLAAPVVPIPMGSGFGDRDTACIVPRGGRLPAAGGYVLLVSTIEARKNHILMFRVWRRLLEELPPEQVPTLVFAGRVGWLVDDLMRQIANADHLGGKLAVIENPSDAELTALYQGCLFTVFPSLYEGWGLPVTESLGFGKPCLIAERTSLPEAGGDLVRGFDPDNLNDAFAAIRDVILDPGDLARWEERVRREFRPVSWNASAEALLAALGYAVPSKTAAGEGPRARMALAEPGRIA